MRVLDPEISGAGQPQVFRPDHAGSWLPVVSQQFVRGSVGGAVVDDDDLKVLEGLIENATDRFVQIAAKVVAGDDDGNLRRRYQTVPGARSPRAASAIPRHSG